MNDATNHNRLANYTQWLLIWMAVGLAAGRILSAEKPNGKKGDRAPMFSANDRSRWATILAVVKNRRFEIDDIIYRNGKRTRFQTIDLVQHRARDGRQHYYSSKPPFLPILVAVQYAPLHAAGLSLEEHTTYVIRVLLLTTNLLPFLLYLIAIRYVARRTTDDARAQVFVVGAAGFATLLSPFLVTLNNHLPAAIAVGLVLVLAFEILRREKPPIWLFPPTGVLAAFTVANELPALAFLGLVGLVLLRKAPLQTLLGFAPGAVAVAAVYFGLNFVAHEDWIPPYAHRRDGAEIGKLDAFPTPLGEGPLTAAQQAELSKVIGDEANNGIVCFRATESRWSLQLQNDMRYALVDAGGGKLSVRAWGNWYDYPGSYWQTEKKGVDRGEPSRATYAFHALFGHHGIFSLTPIWLISLLGLTLMAGQGRDRALLAALIVGLSVIVIGFYIARPEIDRNYGGVSCGFRWSFWLIPLWLVPLGPGLAWLQRRSWGVGIAVLLLSISIASAHYAANNPWRHPWLFDYLTMIGWINYQ